jgi:hypothetical protein
MKFQGFLSRTSRFVLGVGFFSMAVAVSSRAADAPPNFGPNVYIFDPSMPTSQIQATVNQIATQQVSNQFGTQRYTLLFEPGTYGSSATPLIFQVGFYTEVAGLGASPDDVVINGTIDVYNQCDQNGCNALDNFWRSLSNLRINLTQINPGCYFGEFWAVSQAAPWRRVDMNGQMTGASSPTPRPLRSSTARSSSSLCGTVTSERGPTGSGTRSSPE